MSKVLVIGDAHIDEEQSLDRFDALGQYIVDNKPDEVVIIGDFLSFNCLSEWDKNKRKQMENKRYISETTAGNTALDAMMGPTDEWNKSRKAQKKALYLPNKTYIKGNHEDRLDRYLDHDPVFEGAVSLEKDLDLEARGWKVVGYKEVHNIQGVSFTHIPIASNGKAIGNPNVAQKALRLFGNSVVFGHTHTLDHAAEHRHGSPHLNQSLSVGCFFEHVDEYAQGSMTNYWRGIVSLDIYSENRFDINTLSMRQLKDRYGK